LRNTAWDAEICTVLDGGKLDGNYEEELLLLLKTLERHILEPDPFIERISKYQLTTNFLSQS
jgi:hypothetical protein